MEFRAKLDCKSPTGPNLIFENELHGKTWSQLFKTINVAVHFNNFY